MTVRKPHKKLPKTYDEAIALLQGFPLPPSLIIDSGSGLHSYVFLKETLTIKTESEREAAQELVRNFYGGFAQYAQPYEFDSTFDITRILRIPGTLNLKDPSHPREVKILFEDCSRTYSIDEIAIVGYGSIGQNVARNLSGFTVEVTGFSRSGRDGALTMDQLDGLLPAFDIVILVLPLNAESKHLFDARRLALLKDGALIVNVARGGIIDTDALVAELNSGRIQAALDVTDPEPLPSDHPLWRAKNVLIAPHVGGDSTAFESRGKKLVEDQIARLAQGAELKNIVAVGKA